MVVVSLVALTHLEKIVNRKVLYQWIGLLSNVINEMATKVHCFASFCHHRLVTMIVHKHAYHYSLFESGMKTGL